MKSKNIRLLSLTRLTKLQRRPATPKRGQAVYNMSFAQFLETSTRPGGASEDYAACSAQSRAQFRKLQLELWASAIKRWAQRGWAVAPSVAEELKVRCGKDTATHTLSTD